MRRVHHDGPVRIVGVGRADEDRGFGSERTGGQLPEGDRCEDHRDEGAAERQPGSPPPAGSGDHGNRSTATLRILDSTHDSRPESGPIGRLRTALKRAQGALQQSPHSPDILGFTTASRASTQVGGDRFRVAIFEDAIEIGADPAAIQQAGQHDHWTREAPTRILMAAHDTRTARGSRRRTGSEPRGAHGHTRFPYRWGRDLSPAPTVWR